ncbi:MAG: hypothetical protein OXM57_05410 [bacterium]|nr:hypothetical protein [bacterium]MDE0352107.1 hypothetical protein [bacterium]
MIPPPIMMARASEFTHGPDEERSHRDRYAGGGNTAGENVP